MDGSAEMCIQAEKNIGQPVISMTFDKFDYEAEFDGIWACASLLHVPSSDIHDVLIKIERALKKAVTSISSLNTEIMKVNVRDATTQIIQKRA